jgi:AcrR family transcriptional regulator
MNEIAPVTSRIYRGQAPEERRSRRRAQLLEAGLELLGTEGWHTTTVTAVCARAGLTPRYFYESFADRDELVVAIFDGVMEEITREALAAEPSDEEGALRATAAACVKVVTDDPRKGRVAFIEALGSEALMKRRLRTMRRMAERLADQVRGGRRVRRDEARSIQTASLVAVGGLIEIMIVWLEGALESTAEQVVDDYTRLCAAALRAGTQVPLVRAAAALPRRTTSMRAK